MPGDEGDRAREVSVRERHFEERPDRQRRRHARNDFIRYSRSAKRLGFLPAATEDQRIASLQTDHDFSRTRPLDEQRVDVRILVRMVSGQIANAEQLGGGIGKLQESQRNELVVENEIRLGEQFRGAKREQPRVARPGPHEKHLCTRWVHVHG